MRALNIGAIRCLGGLLAGAATTLGAPCWANAESPPAPGQGAGNGTSQVSGESGEIVVTAQKRSERLIDVPLSVTFVSSESLMRSGATQLRDFQDTVPGLTVQSGGPGFTQLSLRGVTIGLDVGSTVGLYVDDVPYGSSTPLARGGQITLDAGLFDLDHLEILRGPQGTLYGASTMGGLLKYVTRSPSATAFEAEARAGLSDTKNGEMSYNLAGGVNIPIATDRAALRVSGFYNRDGGYIDNVLLGQSDVNRSNIYGGRADMLLTPSERLFIRLTGFLQNISRGGFPFADYNLNGAPVVDGLAQRRFVPEPFDQRYRLISGTIGYDLGFAELKSISSYQFTKARFVFDYTTVFGPAVRTLRPTAATIGVLDNSSTKKFTEELRLTSRLGQSLEWLIGAYYTHESSNYAQSLILKDAAGASLPNGVVDYSLPTTYEELAGYGNVTLHLSDRFDVTGGLRYARNRQSSEQIGASAFFGSRPLVRTSEGVVTYLANARYHLSDRATAYIRYATGYRPGGPNFVGKSATGATLGDPAFAPDSLRSYEAGFKAQTIDGSFSLDLAAYFIDWNNIQITVSRGGGFNGRDNAPGGAEIRGAELTMIARPSREMTVSGAFAYQDAKLSAADPDLKGDKGERLPNVPRFTAALNADYAVIDSPLKPSVGATLRFTSDRTASFNRNTSFPQYRLPAYEAVDLRAGISFRHFDVQAFVRNLFDVRAELSPRLNLYPITGPISLSMLQPRTVGLSLRARY